MKISRRADHSLRLFFVRTLSAQIHLLALIFAIVGLVLLLPPAAKQGSLHWWGTLVFGFTAIAVFAISATYHFMHDGYQICDRLAALMETLDQSAIYLFIAGTYTPILLNVIAEPWKSILMIAIWAIAIGGIIYTAIRHRLPMWMQSRALYTLLFVLMGCLLTLRMGEAWSHLHKVGAFFMVAGMVSYIVGAVVYATKRPSLFQGYFGFHELWHCLSALGFFLHFALISSFYIG